MPSALIGYHDKSVDNSKELEKELEALLKTLLQYGVFTKIA